MKFLLFTDLVKSTSHSIVDSHGASALRLKMIESTLGHVNRVSGAACQYTGDGFLCLLPTLEAGLDAAEAIIRDLEKEDAKTRAALHFAPELSENIRVLAAKKKDASAIAQEYQPSLVYFESKTYTDVAHCARLLSVACPSQILVTQEGWDAGERASQNRRWKTDHRAILLKDFTHPETPYEWLWRGDSLGRPGSAYLPEYYRRPGTLYIERPQLQQQLASDLQAACDPQSEKPLVVIFGDGGMGKTRLAGEVSLSVAPFFPVRGWVSIAEDVVKDGGQMMDLCDPLAKPISPDKFVELAGYLREAIAKSLGFIEELYQLTKAVGSQEKAFWEAFRSFVRLNPKGLLILDNWEPLDPRGDVPRDAEACLKVLVDLVREAPQWAFLLTTRVQPRVSLGQEVRPLDGGLMKVEARELVQDRWKRHAQGRGPAITDQEADALAEECRFMPLAIELVCSTPRKNARLTPAQVIRDFRLENALELDPKLVPAGDPAGRQRHRTLLASQRFSYNLLSDEEKRVFRGASIFGGRWTYETAEKVLGDEGEIMTSLEEASRIMRLEKEGPGKRHVYFDMHREVSEFSSRLLAELPSEKLEVQGRLIAWAKDFLADIKPSRFEALEAEEAAWSEALLLCGEETEHSDLGWAMDRLVALQGYEGNFALPRHFVRSFHSHSLHAVVEAWLWFRRGSFSFRSGDNEKALTEWSNALRFYEHSGDATGSGNIINRRGDIHFRTGENRKALNDWDRADRLYQQAGDLQGRGNVAQSRGDLYFRSGDNQRALTEWAKADLLYEQCGDPQGRGSVALSRGGLHFRTGDTQRALDEWAKAERFFERAGDIQGRGNVAGSRGDLHFRTGDNQRALTEWDLADQCFHQSGSAKGRGNVARSRGGLHFRTGDYQRALDEWEKADRFYDRAGDPQGRGNVAGSRGELHFRTGDTRRALHEWDKADQLYKRAEDPHGRGHIAQRRGDLHLSAGENQRALKEWEKADQFYKLAGDPQGRGNVAGSRGDLHFRMGDNERALREWDRADCFFQQSGDPVGRGGILALKGRLAASEGRIAEGCSLLREARRIFLEIGAANNSAFCDHHLRELGCEDCMP